VARASPRQPAGEGHGALTDRRTRGEPRRARRAPGGPARLHPHQQHQPHPARRFAGARGGRGRRMDGGPRRIGVRAMSSRAEEQPPLSREDFVESLRREGANRYHDHHRYHALMHEGKLTKVQLQQWVLNRYYYQTRIPIKDAILVSKSEDPAFRRAWLRRIVDHDGEAPGEGGLAQWLRLAEGV